MPIKTAPKTYTWENASSAFKTWFKKYYPGIDYDSLYSEDKFLVRDKFDKNLKPINGHLTVTQAQRNAIRKTTEGFADFIKKYGGEAAKLKSALDYNPDRFYGALKKAGINVYMVGDQYRFANTGPTNINKFKSAFEIKPKYSDAQLNSFAQIKHTKNWKQLTEAQQDNIRSQLSQGAKIKKRTKFTPLSLTDRTKVLQEFTDAKFDLSKYGYDPTTAKGKGQNTAVRNYIDRGFKLRNFKSLSKPTQRDIINKFSEIPKDQWDFKRFQYGLPGASKPETSALIQRIRTFAMDPKPWRYGFQLRSPGAWMLAQMDRAITDHGNTRFESLLKDGRVIGMKDNGVAYYANRNVAPSNAAKLIQSHPNFNEVQKIIDIADRANTPLIKLKDAPSRALVELFPEGFNSKNLSLNRLLAYTYKHKGLKATQAAIEKHHIEPLKAMGDPVSAKNIQPLRKDIHRLIEVADRQIRKTPSDLSKVAELEALGARFKIDGTTYGTGTRDISKILTQETEALYEPLSKYRPKDWNKLQAWLTKSFKEGSVNEQRLAANALNCGKSEGGRIGYALGSATIKCVNTKLANDPVRSSMALRTTEGIGKMRGAATNFLKMLGRGGLKAAPYAAIAAAGAAIEPLVKQFRSDDPTTYLSDENQQKGMLLSMIEAETPKVDEEILKWQMPAHGAATAAGAIPGAKTLYQERRGVGPKGPLPKGVGKTRAALGLSGVLGKALGASFSPLAVAATLPMDIAAQRKGGSDWADIATSPGNWMGPAFMGSGYNIASKGIVNPTLLKLLRFGISRGALAAMGPVGWAGLAGSLGLAGYDMWKNRGSKKKRLYDDD